MQSVLTCTQLYQLWTMLWYRNQPLLFINVHHCMYIVHTGLYMVQTCLYMVQTCSSCFMSLHGSSQFTRFCWKHFRDVCSLYSPVLSCTSCRQCYGTGISHLVHTGYVNVQQCLYISWNVCSLLYTEHELHNTQYTGLYIVCTCLYDSKRVCTCINMYIHVWTMYVHVCPECTYYVHTNMSMILHYCTYHVHTCIYISWYVHTRLSVVCTIALSEECTYMVQTCMYMFIPGG